MADHNFSHLDTSGQAIMVDVAPKPIVQREAMARGKIWLAVETLTLLKDQHIPKGDVLTVAKIAGIQAAKQTSNLLPLCHLLTLDVVSIAFTIQEDGIVIQAEAKTTAKTGVEMEALVAVSIAALTIYDMCKAVDKTMQIGEIVLCHKSKQSA